MSNIADELAERRRRFTRPTDPEDLGYRDDVNDQMRRSPCYRPVSPDAVLAEKRGRR